MNATIGADISIAKEILEKGELVAIPTETVYGLAGNGILENAILKIFEAKNRPFFDPLILHFSSVEKMHIYVEDFSENLLKLATKFWPGPLTILINRKSTVPDLITAGLEKVAVRIPNHPVTLRLLQQVAFPLAAPSANPFGYISPTSPQHVYDQLAEKIPYILDGGDCEVGLESTIVGEENGKICVYRLGGLSILDIEAVVGKVNFKINKSSNPSAPGMLKTHYSPQKELQLIDFETFDFTPFSDKKLGFLRFSKSFEMSNKVAEEILSKTENVEEAAKVLFSKLRILDNSAAEIIFAEYVPLMGLGLAINDRLKRAATPE